MPNMEDKKGGVRDADIEKAEKESKKSDPSGAHGRSGGYSESDYQLLSQTFIPDLLVQLFGSIITKDYFSKLKVINHGRTEKQPRGPRTTQNGPL